MEVKFTKNHYPIAKGVTWDDAIRKIDNDQDGGMEILGGKPTFVCRSSFTPRSIKKVKEKALNLCSQFPVYSSNKQAVA